MSRPLSTRNILSKSVNAFMSNVANRQTERQTNEQTDRHGQNIYQKHLTSSSGVNDVEGRSRSLAIPIRHNSVVCIVTTVYRVSFLRHFYRATHMHRADYAVARCLPVRLSVCLSIRPSHRRYCVQTVTYIVKVFSPSGSPTILVFSIPNGMAIFRRRPP